ncbi:MAG: response regulator [Deltaproteobacteria bacterium]|nr:response regulator [Deltaproteobacteria bacterium]
MPDVKTETCVKVLFVDDERKILGSLRRLMLDEDVQVFTASSGEEGLAILKENPEIGVIVSDQRMPGLSGVSFLNQSRKIAPDAYRIVLSGYADMYAAMDAINLGGAWRYMTKPWNDDDMLSAIRQAAQQYRRESENRKLRDMVAAQNAELKQWSEQLQLMAQEQTVELQNKDAALKRLEAERRRTVRDAVRAFSDLFELRGRAGRGHARNVSEIASAVAREIKLSTDETESVRLAALLHDIGKIRLSDAALIKQVSDLDPKEQTEYRLHPLRGQVAVDTIEGMRNAGVLIRHHHERHDGKGFPDGYRGEKVPRGARIIALADFWDHTVKSVGKENRVEKTMALLKEELGSRFDPKLFPPFEKSVRELYSRRPDRSAYGEIELPPTRLKAKMVLSRDFRSGTDILILKKRSMIDPKKIELIKRYYLLDPPKCGVFIRTQK